jgi:hypothetical protein
MFQPTPLPFFQACTTLALLFALGGPVWADEPLATPGITPSESGGYVKDRKTGLVWPRCAEGLNWRLPTAAERERLVSMVTGEARGDVPSRLKLPVRLTLSTH